MALALGALPASGATTALAAPAVGATGDVKCPSADCVRIAPGAGSPVAVAPDNAGAVYLAYSGGDLLRLDLATGAFSTVTTGLGNLRGVAVPDGGTAHVVATGLGFSYGLAFDKAGLACTADMGQGRVLRTDVSTGTTRVLASEAYEPTSISVGGDGQVYFQVGDEVKRVNPATGVQSHVTNLLGINTFSFSLAASGDAYTAGDGLWRIGGLTSR